MRHIAQQIHAHIQRAHKIVIVPHQHPDGDALGAATAFYEYLLTLGKDAQIFCVTPATSKLHFLPHAKILSSLTPVISDKTVDTIVVVDSGDLRYNGIAEFIVDHPATIINIDHHVTNERYGHINLVNPTASSTCEILYHYFYHNHIPVNRRMATSLLTGLTTDTGNFTNSATSASALSVGGELIRSGGNYQLINDETVRNKSVDALRLWGVVLSRLKHEEKLGITHTFITKADLELYKVPENETEGIANFLNNLDNTRIALILKETDGNTVKGSFRTTRDDVDVSAMAKALGGGGHKKAAGFNTVGTIDEVLKKILTLG
ncbi:MAG: hypothetical protein EXS55_01350 [Candidatus Magasanikbacteria bacterium]|nr:hypothetical protein [Candidatus Magasanikbacteria bacterium]